jgi:hypothetical protein
MANYVENRVVCTKEILDKYFIDYCPFGDKLEKPYISFNKIVNVSDLNEYYKKYGTYIYYGYGFDYKKLPNDKWEIKFLTQRLYPINAIVKSIEILKNDIVWYSIEDNYIYLSKFSWNGTKVTEEVLNLQNDDYDNFEQELDESGELEKIEYPDGIIWHYNYEKKDKWLLCDTENLITRYLNTYPSKEVCNKLLTKK